MRSSETDDMSRCVLVGPPAPGPVSQLTVGSNRANLPVPLVVRLLGKGTDWAIGQARATRAQPHAEPVAGSFTMNGTKASGIKTLNLVKGNEQFCFRYEVGQESKVLESLIDMVNRRELTFDWFDAAVLSHQLGQHLAKELKTYLPKKAA
jgi:hypothetical protein